MMGSRFVETIEINRSGGKVAGYKCSLLVAHLSLSINEGVASRYRVGNWI